MDKVKRTFFISPDDIKGSSYVNYNLSDDLLGKAIRETQEVHLQAIIGSNLYYRLQELVFNAIQDSGDTIDDEGFEAYKELLDDYVQPYLEEKTQAVLCVPATYKLRNFGVAKNSDTNIESPSLRDVMALQKRFNTSSAKYATRLSMWLCANKDAFPELSETSCGCGIFVPAVLGKKFVATGLVLGDTRNKCKC